MPPAHPSPQLVELAEAKALGVFNDHDGGVGNVHPHLDDGGGDQDVRLPPGEGGHHRLLFPGFHLPVDKGDFPVGEDLLLELFGIGGDGLAVIRRLVVALFDHGTDDVGLTALAHELVQKGVDPGMIAAGDGVGLHRLSPRGQLVDDGDVQVSVQNQRQRPRDGSGGHDQHVGMAPLGGQGCPLGHAEAVLLVGDHQAQVGKFHAAGEQGMGANGKVDLSGGELFQNGAFGLGGGGACQQGAANVQPLHQGGQTLVVLPGQDLRGGHQCRLAAVFHHEVHACGSHHGLAGAHVPLAQAVHGGAGAHIREGFLHTAALCIRQGKGQGAVKALHIHVAAGGHGDHFPAAAQALEADGEEKQLLKGQPPSGDVQGLGAFREVDIFIGIPDAAQVVGLADIVRQHVRENVGARIQPLADGPGEHQLGNPGGEGIDGDDAPRLLPAALRFHNGGGHLAAQKAPLRPAAEDVGLPLPEIVFQPGLVEKGHVQHAGLIHRPDFDEIHALADMGKGGRRGYHGRHAGGLAVLQFRDVPQGRAVLVAAGEPGDEIPQRGDAQLGESLGFLGADAPDELYVGGKIRHGIGLLAQYVCSII